MGVITSEFSSFDYAPWNALIARYLDLSSDEWEKKRDPSAEKELEVKTPSPPEVVKAQTKGKAKVTPVVEVPRPIPRIKLGPPIESSKKESEGTKGAKGKGKGKVRGGFKIVIYPELIRTGLEPSDLRSVHRSEEGLLLPYQDSLFGVLFVWKEVLRGRR